MVKKPVWGNIFRLLLRMLYWFMATLALLVGLALIDFRWNLLDWSPKPEIFDLGELLLCCLALVGMGIMAARTHDRATWIFSFAICLLLLVLGGFLLPPEEVTSHKLNDTSGSMGISLGPLYYLCSALARSHESPIWYRILRSGFLFMPLLIWFWGLLRLLKRSLLEATTI